MCPQRPVSVSLLPQTRKHSNSLLRIWYDEKRRTCIVYDSIVSSSIAKCFMTDEMGSHIKYMCVQAIYVASCVSMRRENHPDAMTTVVQMSTAAEMYPFYPSPSVR